VPSFSIPTATTLRLCAITQSNRPNNRFHATGYAGA
jgi:hypothetical protein